MFAQDQVDALPPPATPAPLEPPIEPLTGDTLAPALDPLRELAASIDYTVTVQPLHGPDGVCNPKTKTITVDSGLSANGQVATMIHELAHALLRHEHGDQHPALSYAQEELLVESVSFSVCRALGLDTSVNSVPYLAAWSQNTDLAILLTAAETVNHIANRIEDALPTPN